MAAAVRHCMTFVARECQQFVCDLRVISSVFQGHGENLVFNTATIDQPHEQSSRQDVDPSSSVLDSIFSNVLMAVQRDRRSLERRMTRRMQMAGHFEYAVPRKDIVVDLDTGHWKEKGTICSSLSEWLVERTGLQQFYYYRYLKGTALYEHHYEKVKAEMEQMREELGEAMQYTADQKEVVFLYQGEESQAAPLQEQGKHVVHMKKERPSWFSSELLKRHGD